MAGDVGIKDDVDNRRMEHEDRFMSQIHRQSKKSNQVLNSIFVRT